jgi:hypothetical protein
LVSARVPSGSARALPARLSVLIALQAASSPEAYSFVTRVIRRLFVLWHYSNLVWSVACLLTWLLVGFVVSLFDCLVPFFFACSLDIYIFPYLFIAWWLTFC